MWLSRVVVKKHWKVPDLDLDLSPPPGAPFRHLVLTGPNGSGKTTVLGGLRKHLTSRPSRGAFTVDATWSDRDAKASTVGECLRNGSLLLLFTSANRSPEPRPVNGPTSALGPFHKMDEAYGPLLKQHLVNLHVQARLARDDEPAASERIFAWLEALERGLAELFELPGLELRFVRETYDLQFVEATGARYGFEQLSSGFAAVLNILGELILRVDARSLARDHLRSGVVLIDEIDAYLHPSLERRILPFLSGLYPQVQFVIATHSPAVATSLPNTLVVNLGNGRRWTGDQLVGRPYGAVLRLLFELATDLDAGTEHDLERLEHLLRLPRRTDAEAAEFEALAERLQRTGHPLAREAWVRLHLAASP